MIFTLFEIFWLKCITPLIKRSGYRHWYEVRYTYKNKEGVWVFKFNKKVALLVKSSILNRRLRNELVGNLNTEEFTSQGANLCNGTLDSEVLSYLGFLKGN